MNECGGDIRGGQAAAMAAGSSMCLCVCACACVCVWDRRKGEQACCVVSAPEWAVN